MPTLEVCIGDNGREFFELSSDETLVGRDHFCDIVLRNHTVSRQHARIVRAADGFYIEDLSSLNGTYLNGRRLEGRAPIKDQDRIHIYEVVTIFHAGTPNKDEGDGELAETLADVPLPEEVSRAPAAARQVLAQDRAGDVTSQARFRAALKISLDLEGENDVDRILPKILDSLFEIFPQAARGYILLEEGTDGHLVPRAIKHRKSEMGHSMTFGPISRKMALHVMSTAEAILMDDAAADQSEANQSVLEMHSLSMICAPLMGPSRRPLGIVYLDTTDAKRRFVQAHLDVLVSVATMAAQEVESAGARRAGTYDTSTYQRQLGTAKQVQLQFLPQSRPQVEGYQFYDYYQPADEVGGDYFGYIPLPDGRLALAIGDVAGKGVSAALLMAHFCAEVRYCLATSATPAEAVDHLNQDLSSERLNYHFVTFALCVLDPKSHRMTVVNAGHLPPLRRRGSLVETIGGNESGLPLGCDEKRNYQQLEITLEPGDAVLLYTDGISEAMNAKGDVYGGKRMREALVKSPDGVEGVGQAILDDVRRFIRGRLQSDDICLVCFAREG